MRRTVGFLLSLAAAVLALPVLHLGAAPGLTLPGLQPNGSRLLIDNWTITPAGRQSTLGELPLNMVLSPNGQYLLVTNGGADVESLQVISTADSRTIQTIPYAAPAGVLIGVAYSPDGKHAYAAGGGQNLIHTFSVGPKGSLTAGSDIRLSVAKSDPYPLGLSVAPGGRVLYVAENLSNDLAIVDTASGAVLARVPVGAYPYQALVDSSGKHVYVSNWGDGTVSVIDTATRTVVATVATEKHPCAMAFGPRGALYVADANSDAVSVINRATNEVAGTISVRPNVQSPLSASPQGLAVSPDGNRLYVANAGENDVDVFGLGQVLGTASLLGRLPTAWYPTAVAAARNGKTLFVANAKGFGAGPNSGNFYWTAPNPARTIGPFIDGYCNCAPDKFSGSMIPGTLSTIPVPSTATLYRYSRQVALNDHFGDRLDLQRSPENPVPLPGRSSPIKHVIYVIKENRSYDQVMGDDAHGNGDPSLTLFPRAVTPNHHALADRFGLMDNFYADAEVSPDGHNWVMSANASDYNEKMWPQFYGGNRANRPYDFEGGSSINLSPGGYLWDAAAAAHISYRNYGEFYLFDANYGTKKLIPSGQAGSCAGPVTRTYTGMTIPAGQTLCFAPMDVNGSVAPKLVGHYDPRFRNYDMHYPESGRVAEWKREFRAFAAKNKLPRLEILRLPNDHTAGTSLGGYSPKASMAQNDLALGQVVDTVSHSRYWPSTAIFVTEDDAQNGPDHVEAHRTVGFVISPYTSERHPGTDHTLYDTASMVRTIELILGLKPMSQYDATAVPMRRMFHRKPDLRPYTAAHETVSTSAVNTSRAFGVRASARMDFAEEDHAPMDALNHLLWHAIKGARVPYPRTSP